MAFKTDIKTQWNGKDVKIKGQRVVGKTIFEVGLVVEGQAKLLSPVKTGRLAGSITTKSRERSTNPSGLATTEDTITAPNIDMEVFVGTAVEYATYMEFGTVKTDAQPFLRPAFDLAQGRTLTIGQREGKFEFRDYLK